MLIKMGLEFDIIETMAGAYNYLGVFQMQTNTTYKILKSKYQLKPVRVAEALIDIIENIENEQWIQSGKHSELVASLDACLDMHSRPDCVLDVVEQIISAFIKDSDALSAISSKLEAASIKNGAEELRLARAYIQEVYLSSRGAFTTPQKQKEILDEIKKDILRQQVVSEKNLSRIHSLESNLEENEKVDQKQTALIDTLEAQLSEKAKLDDQQTELINQIRSAFAEKAVLDYEQSELLEKLQSILEQKDEIDHKQTSSLLKIKEELISKTIKDIEQSSAIDRLEMRISDMQLEIDGLSRKFREAGQGALDRDRMVFSRMDKFTLAQVCMVLYMVVLSVLLFIRS